MLSRAQDFIDKNRRLVVVAGSAAVIAAAVVTALITRRHNSDDTSSEQQTHLAPLSELPQLEKGLRALAKTHKARLEVAARGRDRKKKVVFVMEDEEESKKDEQVVDMLLVAIDSRFQSCVGVFLPEHQSTSIIDCYYPSTLASPSIEFHLLPRRIFVGVPPLSIRCCTQQQREQDDDGGEKEHRDSSEEEPVVCYFDEGIASDFSIMEPTLPSCLLAHGLTQSRWSFSISYFLRFPNAQLESNEASPLTMTNLNNNLDSASRASNLSSTATSVAASNFFSLPSLVLSPEAEFDRFLALNSVMRPQQQQQQEQEGGVETQQKLMLLPASMRIGQVLPRVVHECISAFYTENAATLGKQQQQQQQRQQQQQQQHTTKNALHARQVAASFETQIRRRVMEVLPERLFRECAVRVSDVVAERVIAA